MAGRLISVYLVDTNVWLERFLDQGQSEELGRFLEHTSSEQLAITDFAFHSIGIVLIRLDRHEALLHFVPDAFVGVAMVLICLKPQDMQRLAQAVVQFSLDFDDAYQYVEAEKHDLTIVSFDHDFDRTGRGRKTPTQVLQTLS